MDSSKNTWSSYTFDLNNFDKNFPSIESKDTSKWTNKFFKNSDGSFWNRVGMYILVIGAVVFTALIMSGYTWSSSVLATDNVSTTKVTVTPIPNTTPYGVRPFNDPEDDTPAITFAPSRGPATGVPTTPDVWSIKAANDF